MTDPNIVHVSVKLPYLWTSCPETWFIQVAMHFALKGIPEDETKHQAVVTSIAEDILIKIIGVVHNPSLNNRYNYIK